MKSALLTLAVVGPVAGCSSGLNTRSTDQGKTTLAVAVPSDITDFDPHTNQLNEYAYVIRNTVFSFLVKNDEKLNIVPDLATPTVNSDATEFVFKLREGVRFHDGTPMTPDAVVQSLKRAAGSKGIFATLLGHIDGYETPDPATVVLRLNKGNAALLDALTNIAILAPSSFTTASRTPVGSGPFKFVGSVANREITLTRFDDYFDAKPAYKDLVFKITTDPQVAVNNLYSGAVDVVSEASVPVVKQLNSQKAVELTPATSNSMAMLEINCSGKLANPKVRQALALALDKKTIQSVVYNGKGDTTYNVVTPGPLSSRTNVDYPYDLDRAKTTLQDAGVQSLDIAVILPAGYPEAEQTARVWQSSLAKIGVNLDIQTQEISIWLQNYINHKYDVTWNLFNESGDPNSFFNIILTPRLQADYKNPAVQNLITRSISVSDPQARSGYYEQLATTIANDLPVAVIQTRPVSSVTTKNVHGLQLSPLGRPIFNAVTFS